MIRKKKKPEEEGREIIKEEKTNQALL